MSDGRWMHTRHPRVMKWRIPQYFALRLPTPTLKSTSKWSTQYRQK